MSVIKVEVDDKPWPATQREATLTRSASGSYTIKVGKDTIQKLFGYPREPVKFPVMVPVK